MDCQRCNCDVKSRNGNELQRFVGLVGRQNIAVDWRDILARISRGKQRQGVGGAANGPDNLVEKVSRKGMPESVWHGVFDNAGIVQQLKIQAAAPVKQ